MDIISFNEAATANSRIESFNANPDSTSGIVTVPTVIAAGESVTIPAGRTAVLPNIQVDGTLTVAGEVFIPSGATMSKLVGKVTSTDNAVVRFDGTTGDVQNSGVTINDKNWVNIGGYGDAYLDILAIHNSTSENIFRAGLAGVSNGLVISKDNVANMTLTYSNQTGGGNTFVINSAGNVGIGVTPSAWYGGKHIQTLYSAFGESAAGYTDIQSNSYEYSANAFKYLASGVGASRYTANFGYHSWYTAPSGTAGNAISWTNAMTLDATASLQVLSDIAAGYSNGVYSGSAQAIRVFNANANNFTQIVGRSTSDTSSVFYSAVGGVAKSFIQSNGTFGSATNVYGSTSDVKLKENIVDTSPKLDKLMKVQVRNFNYIGQEDKQIGVIAQEVEKIFPGIVYETKDTKQVEVEKEREKTLEDGTVEIEKYTETETVETGEVTKNVKYSIIYMMMLKGMQEMNAKMEAMQLEIDELKGAK